MFRSILIAGLALALAACGSMGTTTTPEQQIAAGCASASAALKGLTIANMAGKLSAEQQTQISAASNLIYPVCASPTPPTLDTVKLAAFTQAIALLQAQALKLEQTP